MENTSNFLFLLAIATLVAGLGFAVWQLGRVRSRQRKDAAAAGRTTGGDSPH